MRGRLLAILAGFLLALPVFAVPSAVATHRVASVRRPRAGQRENASFVPSGENSGRAS